MNGSLLFHVGVSSSSSHVKLALDVKYNDLNLSSLTCLLGVVGPMTTHSCGSFLICQKGNH